MTRYVLERQLRTEIYLNEADGCVVIEQDADCGDEGGVVVFSSSAVPRLIDALRQLTESQGPMVNKARSSKG